MFARLFAIASLAALAAASNAHLVARGQCTTGNINCCKSTLPTSQLHNQLSQIGINTIADLTDLTGLSGTGCSPISAVGVDNTGATCTQQPVCCDQNVFTGISVGCSPININ